MRFACDACQTRYELPDEKIRGRALKIRCRSCGRVIEVRDPSVAPAGMPNGAEGAGGGAPIVAPADSPGRDRGGVAASASGTSADRWGATQANGADREPAVAREGGAEAAPAGAGPRPVPGRGEPSSPRERSRTAGAGGAGARSARAPQEPEEWFALERGEQLGPMEREALAALVASGRLGPRNFVWREGMADWQRIESVPELSALLPRDEAADEAVAPAQEIGAAPPAIATERAALPQPAAEEEAPEPDAAPIHLAAPREEVAAAPWSAPAEDLDAWIPAAEPAPAPVPTAGQGGRMRLLRLVGAGVLIAAAFAAGAYLLLPTGPVGAGSGGPGAASSAPLLTAGRVGVAQLQLPARAPLAQEAIVEALATRLPGWERCVEDHPPASRSPRRIHLRVVVARSGLVTSSSVVESDAGDLGACLADRTRDIRFPAFEGDPLSFAIPIEIDR